MENRFLSCRRKPHISDRTVLGKIKMVLFGVLAFQQWMGCLLLQLPRTLTLPVTCQPGRPRIGLTVWRDGDLVAWEVTKLWVATVASRLPPWEDNHVRNHRFLRKCWKHSWKRCIWEIGLNVACKKTPQKLTAKLLWMMKKTTIVKLDVLQNSEYQRPIY